MTTPTRLLEPTRTLVMGVVNVTPDSFYAQSRRPDPKRALDHGLDLVSQGADVVDVGGESTRPGSDPVPLQEELNRVMPIIEGLARHTDATISIDTMKAEVAREAIAAGARMVNDVSALRADSAMAGLVAESELPVVLMHMRGTPRTMQRNPSYDDVVAEVGSELEQAVERATRAGIARDRIWVDPGIGFGKRLEDNLELIRQTAPLKKRLGLKLLLGTSRKSFIGQVLGLDDPAERLEGTLATVAISTWLGVDAVRVHDVQACRRVVRMVEALRPTAAATAE